MECLKTASFLTEKEDYTANGLFQKYKSNQVNFPRRGALIFSVDQENHAKHVAICLDHQFKIEAIGGNYWTTSISSSWNDNAYVKIRPINFNKNKYKVIYLFKD